MLTKTADYKAALAALLAKYGKATADAVTLADYDEFADWRDVGLAVV
jgi:hypothetical protein